MRRGRKPKSVEEKKQAGSYRPGAHSDRSELAAQYAGAPVRFADIENDEHAIWAWNHLLEALPPDVLTLADTVSMHAFCYWWSVFRRNSVIVLADPTDRNALLATEKAWTKLERLGAAYGLNLADRQRLKLPAKDKDSGDPMADQLGVVG